PHRRGVHVQLHVEPVVLSQHLTHLARPVLAAARRPRGDHGAIIEFSIGKTGSVAEPSSMRRRGLEPTRRSPTTSPRPSPATPPLTRSLELPPYPAPPSSCSPCVLVLLLLVPGPVDGDAVEFELRPSFVDELVTSVLLFGLSGSGWYERDA